MPAVYGWPLVNVAATATIIALFFENALSEQPSLVKVPQNILMLGLFGAILLSHLAHTYFGGMLDAFTQFGVNFILFFVILNALNTERKLKIAIWFIIFLISAMAVQGIFQTQTGIGWAGQAITRQVGEVVDKISGKITLEETFRINWVGIFNDPNDLALTFVVAIGILFALLLGKSGVIVRIISLVLIGLLSYGVYLTNSRGGLLALAVTGFFYFVKRSKKMLIGSIIGILCVVAVFAFGPSRKSVLSLEDESAANRVEMWYEGMQMLKSNPLFGIGYRMFQEDLPLTAHNSYVLAFAELGLLGFFFFVGLLFTSFRELSIVQAHNASLGSYALGLQTALVGFCAAAFFLSRTYVILPYLLAAISGSMLFITQQKNRKLQYVFGGKEIANTFFLCLGLLMAIFIIIKIGT